MAGIPNAVAPRSQTHPMDSINGMKPPTIVRLIAALSIMSGAATVIHMIFSGLRGHAWIDLAVIGIPVGHGLLKGSQTSRSWAIWVSAISGILILAMIAWGVFKEGLEAVSTQQVSVRGIYVLLMLLICAIVVFGLRSTRARAWFEADAANRIHCGEWTIPLLVVGALFAAESVIAQSVMESSHRELQNSINRIYSFRTQFEFRDAKTKERVNAVGYQSGDQLRSGQDPLGPRASFTWKNDAEGNLLLELSGFAGRPFEATFISDGYKPYVYRFTEGAPEREVLGLQAK